MRQGRVCPRLVLTRHPTPRFCCLLPQFVSTFCKQSVLAITLSKEIVCGPHCVWSSKGSSWLQIDIDMAKYVHCFLYTFCLQASEYSSFMLSWWWSISFHWYAMLVRLWIHGVVLTAYNLQQFLWCSISWQQSHNLSYKLLTIPILKLRMGSQET